MKDNPINLNRIRLAQAATGISPADFPLGSTQSRAAARAILDQSERSKPRRSPYDRDALDIVSYARIFHCDSDQLRATAIHKRGEQLEHEPGEYIDEPSEYSKPMQWEDPTDPMARILDKLLLRSGLPPLPSRDVKWRKPLVELLFHHVALGIFKEAWERQLPEISFPVRVDSGDPICNVRMFCLEPSGGWNEYTHSYMILEPAKELAELLQQEQINAKN